MTPATAAAVDRVPEAERVLTVEEVLQAHRGVVNCWTTVYLTGENTPAAVATDQFGNALVRLGLGQSGCGLVGDLAGMTVLRQAVDVAINALVEEAAS